LRHRAGQRDRGLLRPGRGLHLHHVRTNGRVRASKAAARRRVCRSRRVGRDRGPLIRPGWRRTVAAQGRCERVSRFGRRAGSRGRGNRLPGGVGIDRPSGGLSGSTYPWNLRPWRSRAFRRHLPWLSRAVRSWGAG
jgi:hypothetical protein